jgi:hypothetical protein
MEVNGIVDYRRWSIYAVDFEGDAPLAVAMFSLQ